MFFFESFWGQYLVQAIVYSLVTLVTIECLLAVWHIREPLLLIQFRFLVLLLPLIGSPVYLLLPWRNTPHFRYELAIINLNDWLSLGLGGGIALWHLFVAVLAVSTVIFLVQEGVPAIKYYFGYRTSFPNIHRGQFPELDEVLASMPGFTATPVLSPEKTPVAYSLGSRMLVISASMIDLLDGDELRAVIEHEAAHLSGPVVWINRAFLTLRFLMVYNPIAFFVFYRVNHDIEKLCDDMAVRSSGRRLALTSGLLKLFRLSAAEPSVTRIGKLLARPRLTTLKSMGHRNIVRERVERIVRRDEANAVSYRNVRLALTVVMLSILLFFIT